MYPESDQNGDENVPGPQRHNSCDVCIGGGGFAPKKSMYISHFYFLASHLDEVCKTALPGAEYAYWHRLHQGAT